MYEESMLLGEPDTPETIQKRVFSIMESLAAGEPVGRLTEKEVKDVENMLNKIRSGLLRAKKSVLTDDDILSINIANLSVLSPSPALKNQKSKNSMPSRKPSISSLEELDYEESIDSGGPSESSSDEEKGVLRIDTESEKEDEKPVKKKMIKRKASISSSGLQIVKNRNSTPAKKPMKVRSPKRESPEVIVISSGSEWESSPESSPAVIPTKKSRLSNKMMDLTIKEEEVDRDGDDEEEDVANVSKAEFLRKLTKEEPFLKMRQSKMTTTAERTGLTYPLGVTYDTPSDTWFITNTPFDVSSGFGGESKVLKIYTGTDRLRRKYTDIEDSLLENPSAITVYKEGSQIAVLCVNQRKQPAIRLINHRRDDRVANFCSWKYTELDFAYEARGLARSKGGNLITTDRPFERSPRLRLFSKKGTSGTKQKTFPLRDAGIPCFIASSDDTVIITDLGTQTVTMITLDDTRWEDVKFQILRVISAIGVNFRAEEMLNNQYFVYVSGAQIDKHGNIIIADAKNHHFKLFKPGMSFVSRISTDFPVPYVSSFHVNEHGECLILSTRETQKVHFAKLTSTNRLERHIKSGCGGRIGMKTPLSSKRLTYKNGC